MMRTCMECYSTYDDEFRLTVCPHDTFPANDGRNNFTVHDESPLTKGKSMQIKITWFNGKTRQTDTLEDTAFEHAYGDKLEIVRRISENGAWITQFIWVPPLAILCVEFSPQA